ncbi:uncharacterized protein DS421_5g140580 [Arachis hypogaea]|nr:uncharacterized protein DS421_5g140580 [Arachis hypogaea]
MNFSPNFLKVTQQPSTGNAEVTILVSYQREFRGRIISTFKKKKIVKYNCKTFKKFKHIFFHQHIFQTHP